MFKTEFSSTAPPSAVCGYEETPAAQRIMVCRKSLRRCLGLSLLISSLCAPLLGHAQAFPSKPIRLVVPFQAGGGNDLLARIISQKFLEKWGQPVIVDNRPGAGGNVGADFVAKAAPDGYTILLATNTLTMNPFIFAGMPFDTQKDFAPVAMLATTPFYVVVNNNLPIKDVKELVAYSKANPGKVAFGSSGVGAAAHLTQELFKQVTGADMVHVPYKGTAPALSDLMGGSLQVLTDTASAMMPHVRSGKIKPVAVFSNKRIPGAAEVPTIVESGGPALEGSTWVLFLAPAATPRDIVNRLSQETAKAIQSPELKARFEALGIESVGSTPEQAGKFLDEEIVKWAKVIKTADVKPE
jgi:tripartite-type tricarboxylate transporter receptor subunit TctC